MTNMFQTNEGQSHLHIPKRVANMTDPRTARCHSVRVVKPFLSQGKLYTCKQIEILFVGRLQ